MILILRLVKTSRGPPETFRKALFQVRDLGGGSIGCWPVPRGMMQKNMVSVRVNPTALNGTSARARIPPSGGLWHAGQR
jgi:hypothetical protein